MTKFTHGERVANGQVAEIRWIEASGAFTAQA